MCEVDVNKCDYHNENGFCDSNRTKFAGCKYNENCYFKEWQRLKEKHKNLAKDYAEYIETSKKIDEEVDKKLDEIKAIASNLYYHSITDPVKREAAIYKIIEIVKETRNGN